MKSGSKTKEGKMSGQGPKFVNKQFNSPINLYSSQSVQEALDRQTHVLSNGAVGIDFNQLAKPANLQNSAVLRMLEEEEARQRNGGQPSLKRVAWPPPPEEQNFTYVEQEPVQGKTRGVGEFARYRGSPGSGSSPQPQPDPYSRPDREPVTQSCNAGPGLVAIAAPSSVSSLSPSSPGGSLRQPSPFLASAPKGWAPVTPPATSPLPSNRGQQPPIWQSQPVAAQPLSPWEETLISPHQQDKPVQRGVKVLPDQPQTPQSWQNASSPVPAPYFEPPPSTITLRPEPPISQKPAPVYQAQPAATMATIRGNMRGDQKWPPETVKQQAEAENRARLELAKGPAVRPRRVHKDYSGFFAQHALNSTYPGYRAPPGTQYFAPGYQH